MHLLWSTNPVNWNDQSEHETKGDPSFGDWPLWEISKAGSTVSMNSDGARHPAVSKGVQTDS